MSHLSSMSSPVSSPVGTRRTVNINTAMSPRTPSGGSKPTVVMDQSHNSNANNNISSNTNSQQQQQHQNQAAAAAAAQQAAASLQLLLREDRLLVQYGLTKSAPGGGGGGAAGGGDETGTNQSHPTSADTIAFPYAASLLEDDDGDLLGEDGDRFKTPSKKGKQSSVKDTQQRAAQALLDVERKLALVESLAVKLSRTSPEAVAGHLLRLHGYQHVLQSSPGSRSGGGGAAASETAATTTDTATTPATASSSTLVNLRDRADRLQRQGEVLENIVRRVENSLVRNHDRMQASCCRLQRVLSLSSTLKMILKFQFENSKLQNYDLDDLRDLIRAASSVSVIEHLLDQPELQDQGVGGRQSTQRIAVVERLRPQAEQTAIAVRRAAAALLEEQYDPNHNSNNHPHDAASSIHQPASTIQQLGATLQVYYQLGELAPAVWKFVDQAQERAEVVSRQLWNTVTLTQMTEQARKTAKETRFIPKRMKQLRIDAAYEWSSQLVEIVIQVRNLHRVLARKTDPVHRQVYLDVVAAAPIPMAYQNNETSGHNNMAFNLFTLFWDRFCRSLATIIQNILLSSSASPASGLGGVMQYDATNPATSPAVDPQLLQGDVNHQKMVNEVAALYPAVRASAIEMVSTIHDSGSAGGSTSVSSGGGGGSAATSSSLIDNSGNNATANTTSMETAATMAGILGGSALLDDYFLDWSTQHTGATTSGTDSGATNQDQPQRGGVGENPQAAMSADTWTITKDAGDVMSRNSMHGGAVGSRLSQRFSTSSMMGGGVHTTTTAAVLASAEWMTLQGTEQSMSGLYPLQEAFVNACGRRLREPLSYMFPEGAHDNLAFGENDGVGGGGAGATTATAGGNNVGPLSLLPSKYDIQRFDENIRQELALADPRDGGGDLTAVTMIAECVVDMIRLFCSRAKNAVSGVGASLSSSSGTDQDCSYLYVTEDWLMTEALDHDRKVTAIFYSMANYLRKAPEKTFIAPYRPAPSQQHEEAAAMCQKALAPAIQTIDSMVERVILAPLCRAIDRRMASVLARVHLGVYLDSSSSQGGIEEEFPAFVQKHVGPVLEKITGNLLARFPPDYSAVVASTLTTFVIYTFISNAALVRGGESARLHITQDVADLEMELEQLVAKSGRGSLSLAQIGNGRPYSEMRALRQLLFWNGLENKNKPADEIAKSLLRETWIKDLRPSTIVHYLFSYAPGLLSSPYHVKRMKAEEYVATLVQLDGSVEDGEDSAWMTVMKCCDSYQQRASSAAAMSGAEDGDPRVPQILMVVGPELMRRRRH